jgi:hypothetical protein
MGIKAVEALVVKFKENLSVLDDGAKEKAIGMIQSGDGDIDELGAVMAYFFVKAYRHEYEFLIGMLETAIAEEE